MKYNQAKLSWILYDWANSAFATTVMAGFFPLFFKLYACPATMPKTESTWHLGAGNAMAGILIAILAPILGAIADRHGTRKQFLLSFALLGAGMTGGLFFTASGSWGWAICLYVLAVIGFSGANTFYDSLLVSVADETEFTFLSAAGYAAGYLGGGVLFALNIWMMASPQTFGLSGQEQAMRFAFLSVAVWWILFSVPLLLFVPSGSACKKTAESGKSRIMAGIKRLVQTFQHLRRYRPALIFLIAYWFYIDGVNTIVKMAVDYGLALGLNSASLVKALLLTQFIGFPAAILYGKLGEKIGARTGLLIGIGLYFLATAWACRLTTTWEFYALAAIIGLVQGGVQSLSRSLYAALIPNESAAEFFGFYNMLGKFASFLGPLLIGLTAHITGNPRLGILSLFLLFAMGGGLLTMVPMQINAQSPE